MTDARNTEATPADVRKLGRKAGVQYAKLAIQRIDRFGDAVPVELIEVASSSIRDAVFNTAELMHSRGVEGDLIAAFIDGAFVGLGSKIAARKGKV